MASVVYFGLALFTLASVVHPFQVDSFLNRYTSVISDVHEYYGTSSIFFVISCNNGCLEDYSSVSLLSRDFSRKFEFTSVIHLDELDKCTKWYQKKTSRSLLVIFLRTLREIAEFAGKVKYTSRSYIWLVIFINEFGSSAFCEYCKTPKGNTFRLQFDTEMLVLCCDSLILKEWWSSNGEHTEESDAAAWTDENRNESMFLAPEALNRKRRDVNGAGIRIGLVRNSSSVYEVDGRITGLFGDMFTELKSSMNFTITEIVRSSGYGTWIPETNNWTGIIGRLVKGEVDLGVGDFTITNSRLEVLDFTLTLQIAKSKLYIRVQGEGDSVYWPAYFQSFSLNVWIVTILLIILASILIAVIKVIRISRSLPSLISESYLYVWGMFCQQGLCERPVRASLRIAYFSMFMLAVIIYAAYGGSLVSFLTISPSGLPFSTLEGFINDGSYRLIVLANSSNYDFFANSTNPVLMKMMRLMKPMNEHPESDLAAWEQVCREKVAYYTNDFSVAASQNQPLCNIATIDSGYEDALAMIMPIGSQYRRVINYHIQRFKDMGVLNRIKNEYSDSTSTSAKATFDQLDVADVAPPLVALTMGIMLASLVLLGEALYYSRNSDLRNVRGTKNFWNFRKSRTGNEQVLIDRLTVGLR